MAVRSGAADDIQALQASVPALPVHSTEQLLHFHLEVTQLCQGCPILPYNPTQPKPGLL